MLPTAAPAPLLDDDRIVRLGSEGFFVVEDFLGLDLARQLRAETIDFIQSGALRPAAMSRGASARVERASRGDEIAWLDPAASPPALRAFQLRLEALRDEINQAAWLGLRRYEVQVARYAGDGTGYVRHRDAFPGLSNRALTAIYYLNEAWAPADGGILRLFPEGAPDVEIEPHIDRLVIFLSARLEHEVRPAWAERLAITAWFYGSEELPR